LSYTPLPGSVPARAVAHLNTLPEGTELCTAELAEAIGHAPSSVNACLDLARRHGVLMVRLGQGNGPRPPLMWRLGTALDQLQAAQANAAEKKTQQQEHEAEKAQDVKPSATPTPGPQLLNWKPARPMYAPPAEPEVSAIQQDLKAEAAPTSRPEEINIAPREQHLATRAWFSSDGQLVVETPELELVFPRLEARQLVRTIKELGEAWA
jgi:hypothetical protein